MGVNSGTYDDDDAGEPQGPHPAASDPAAADAPTRPLVGAGMNDRCVSCDAPLASDQRYCLNCGERRGKSRFPATGTVAPTAEPSAASGEQPHERNRRRVSSGATLVAGIATLLLALGVGVEIGRTSKSSTTTPARANAPSVQVVTVGGSGGGANAAPTTTTVTGGKAAKATNGNRRSNNGSNNKQAQTTVVTKKVAAKANAAASKVLGADTKNLAPITVQPGQSCSHGAGCQNGKFTGNFFSP